MNRLMSKQETIESQMIIKQTQVQELQSQAQRLKTIEPEKEQEIEAKRVMIEEKFKKIQEPLLQKRAQLEKDKKRHQFVRDVEDEDLWINETLPLAVTGEKHEGINCFCWSS